MSDSVRSYGLWPARLLWPMGLPRQEYWSGLPSPPPGGLPDPGIEPACLASPALAGGFFTTSAVWEAPGSFVASISFLVTAMSVSQTGLQACLSTVLRIPTCVYLTFYINSA